MKIWTKKIILLLVVVAFAGITKAANLPDKGKKPPTTVYGAPGPLPPGPGAPVGGGMFVLLGLATAYGIKKYKDFKQD